MRRFSPLWTSSIWTIPLTVRWLFCHKWEAHPVFPHRSSWSRGPSSLQPRLPEYVQIVLYGTYHSIMALGRRWIERKTPAHILSIVTTYA